MFSSPWRHSSFVQIVRLWILCQLIFAEELGTVSNNDVGAPHPLQGLQRWDTKLQDLEHKLEDDLHKVEQDVTRVATSKDTHKRHHRHSSNAGGDTTKDKKHHHSSATMKTPKNKISDAALEKVRNDIQNLVNSVKQAEEELERAKAQMDMKEEVIKQKSAEIKTEKIIEELHNGKLNMKVDYVTGKLISTNQKETRPASSIKVSNNNATASNGDETQGSVSGPDAENERQEAVVGALPRKGDDQSQVDVEPALEDIIDAAAAILENPAPIVAEEDNSQKSEEATDEAENAPDNVVKHIEMNPDLKSRVREEIESLRSDADPAVMSMDTQLLLDIVKLAITASLFGLAAVYFKLPPTAGFLLGGMVIGPSCWDIIGEIHQVQTLAQFGSVFLLFEQGLLYSQTYSGAAVLGSALATGQLYLDIDPTTTHTSTNIDNNVASPKSDGISTMQLRRSTSKAKSTQIPLSPHSPSSAAIDDFEEHDPNVVGSILLILLIFSTLAIMVFTDVVSSTPEAVFVSCSIAVCSTTIVSENLHAAHIANTHWGKGVLKMIAIQDLFMVPLLALPEILAPVFEESKDEPEDDEVEAEIVNLSHLSLQLVLVSMFLKGTMVFARHIVSAASLTQARMMAEKSELFTLSIVAYALLIATTSEQLKLSIEAGAVFAGIALMKSPHVPKVLASIQPITSVFGGMYLTSLGMILSPRFVLSEAGSIIQLVCLIGLFKLALVSTVLNRFFDYGITASLAVGSAMAQISEASLLVLAKAQRIGLVSRQTYLLLIPTTCIMLTLAPFSAAHLRRLKMQEVSGSDDGRIPTYLCFLKHLLVLRHPYRSSIPVHSEGQDVGHRP